MIYIYFINHKFLPSLSNYTILFFNYFKNHNKEKQIDEENINEIIKYNNKTIQNLNNFSNEISYSSIEDNSIKTILNTIDSGINNIYDRDYIYIPIIGNSNVGKTTIAKEIQKNFGRNTMLISQDVIRRDMLRVKDGENTEAISLMKELLAYGREHSDIVILEGIMYADWYKPLFELAIQLYDTKVYAYYFDIPFEETLKRHQTKPNCNEFGEEAMRKWWREKDFSGVLMERIITSEKDIQGIVSDICDSVLNS